MIDRKIVLATYFIASVILKQYSVSKSLYSLGTEETVINTNLDFHWESWQ